jgi:hypothetical protein
VLEFQCSLRLVLVECEIREDGDNTQGVEMRGGL